MSKQSAKQHRKKCFCDSPCVLILQIRQVAKIYITVDHSCIPIFSGKFLF